MMLSFQIMEITLIDGWVLSTSCVMDEDRGMQVGIGARCCDQRIGCGRGRRRWSVKVRWNGFANRFVVINGNTIRTQHVKTGRGKVERYAVLKVRCEVPGEQQIKSPAWEVPPTARSRHRLRAKRDNGLPKGKLKYIQRLT
ncbi:unnamed protein product [Danaus chrysippus]|uniref:(African queen) hypothetical protein n=1 Tax=Danaus chrysippus TaxID=151541 RepID=A0A8J2QQI8_9NEOP|nr:unnamed protein product [Danaus chrysippus]